MPALFLFLPIMTFGFLIYLQIASRKEAGGLLLDVGPIAAKKVILVLGYAGILFDFYNLYRAFSPNLEGWEYGNIFLNFTYGFFTCAFLLLIGYSRLQACEYGILLYGNLIKWERIESFFWEPENRKTWFLTLRYLGRLPTFLRERILFIPDQKKNELALLFEKYSTKMSLKGE